MPNKIVHVFVNDNKTVVKVFKFSNFKRLNYYD